MALKMSRSIEKKLLLHILFASFIITTIFTAIIFYLDFDAEIISLNRAFSNIQKISVPGLTKSLWNFENKQMHEQLQSILSIQDMVFVELYNPAGQLITAVGDQSAIELPNTEKRKFPLIHFGLAQSIDNLGTLLVTASKENIFNKMKVKLSYILVSQIFKTFLVSFIILMICRKLITQHLKKITYHLENFKIDQGERPKKLHLSRPKKNHLCDELDDLSKKINILVSSVVNNNRQKAYQLSEAQQKIERQKENAINSAKMVALGEMAGGIAHEINNPLAIILTSISMLQKAQEKNLLNDSMISKSFTVIESTVQRITKIVHGLRSVSRDSLDENVGPIALKEVLDDVLGLCGEKFKNHGVDIQVDFNSSKEDAQILGDPVHLSQVFINLLGNAYDAIENLDEKWIKIDISEEDKFQVIKITDAGKGIPKNIQDKLFTPFFTSKEIGKGTGLGLSISKNIVEKNAGSLDIDNKNPHTCFVIKLLKS